jgi:hypothetical protein
MDDTTIVSNMVVKTGSLLPLAGTCGTRVGNLGMEGVALVSWF